MDHEAVNQVLNVIKLKHLTINFNQICLSPELISLVSDIMGVVENLKKDGKERERLLLDCLCFIVNNKADMDVKSKDEWCTFIKGELPKIVETLVTLSKTINIEKIKKFCICC